MLEVSVWRFLNGVVYRRMRRRILVSYEEEDTC
jgi:hypothetical protein